MSTVSRATSLILATTATVTTYAGIHYSIAGIYNRIKPDDYRIGSFEQEIFRDPATAIPAGCLTGLGRHVISAWANMPAGTRLHLDLLKSMLRNGVRSIYGVPAGFIAGGMVTLASWVYRIHKEGSHFREYERLDRLGKAIEKRN
jgi:hypothetical protein